MKALRAVAAGHICLDITPLFPGDGSLAALRPGALANVGPAQINTGGSVANTGLALRFFGIETALMGKVGADPFGELVRSALAAKGGDEGLITDAGSDTSYSVVIAPAGTDRIFLHNPGANNSFSAGDIDSRALEGAAWFHFGYPPIMRRMFASGGEELELVFRKAREAGCVTSLDMAAVDPASEAGKAPWEDILRRVLPYVDFFVPSWEELAYMAARPLYNERAAAIASGEAMSLERDIEPLAGAARELGAGNMLIKCGAAGFYYQTGGAAALERAGTALGRDLSGWAVRSGFERSYTPERVVSGTGAGDTTIAAFIAAVMSGFGFGDCLHLAAAAGASCVEGVDALGGLKPLPELKRRIDAGWAKQRLLREDK